MEGSTMPSTAEQGKANQTSNAKQGRTINTKPGNTEQHKAKEYKVI